MYFKEGYKIKCVGTNSVHTDDCKKAVTKIQCIRTAELTPRTPENENSSLQALYPEVDKALRGAGLLRIKTNLPKLSTIPDARKKDIELAVEKKEKRRKDRRTVYIHEQQANKWCEFPLHAPANQLAKNTNCPSDSECVTADT